MTEPKEVTYEAEIVDERTGEEIPTGIQKVQSNTLATNLDLTKVGTTVLDEKAEAVLSEPLDPAQVQIRPDGLVYLPWTWYADRLNRAFGRLGWGLVPQSGPMTKEMGDMTLVIWGHWLVVRGVPVGFEMGETAYRPSNHTMSYGDAAAGAKSNALARNCKMLGMSLELWNQEWIGEWKKKYAERVKNPNGNRPEYIWRKKDKNGNGHQPPPETKVTEPDKVEEVKATPEVTYEDLMPWTELKKIPVIERIAENAGVKKSVVAIYLGTLDHSGSYSKSEIEKHLRIGEQNVTQ